MKVVILAGGLGTRISEYTKNIPKPMINIGGRPIIYHIMKQYFDYGHDDFYIALGYKGKIIKNYFKKHKLPWKVNLIDTGINTMTGGRIKRLEKYLKEDTFLLTYGDGISNVNINKLIDFHKKHRKLVTLTCVRPPARFGAVKLKGNLVNFFKEKSRIDEGWINGGFFVFNKKIFNYLSNDQTILEQEPMTKLVKDNQIAAYKHEGFWACMDTLRDKEELEKKIIGKKLF